MRKVVVFTGPTLSMDDVHGVLPSAVVRPPAGRGDLLEVDWHAGDTAVIIDGYFRERRSIGHKEILWLLAEGVDVLGAASMGALRAAELAPFGMRGAGEVYRMYTSGEIDGDDEVGVLHGPAAMGYPATTVALVNLRYACRQATASGTVASDVCERIVAAAKELPFISRSWADIARGLSTSDHEALSVLERGIASGDWDLKKLDALSALRFTDPVDAAPEYAIDTTALTGIALNRKLSRESNREYAPGRFMSDLDILNAARLFDPDYPGLHEGILCGLLQDYAASRGVSVSAYAATKLGVDEATPLPDSLACWLTDTELASLSPADRLRLIMVRVWPTWQSADWRPAMITHLRDLPGWEAWSTTVALADEAMEQNRHRIAIPPPALCARLFLRHWHKPGTSPTIELARRGFPSSEDLGHAVLRFFALDIQRSRQAKSAATR